MAVLNGKPTVMGGYEKGATPRDQDRVTFGIKGSESKMGQGIALDPLMPYHDCFGCPFGAESPTSLVRFS